jgi:SAM-dependent methyltransferase
MEMPTMPTHVSGATGQYAYYDHQLDHPDWASKKVLDFGGNAGNILLDPNCQIVHENYWSIDVSRDGIGVGRRRHPRAHFILYDRYNFAFNATGKRGLPIPDPGERFDIIIGHSVITHVSKAETLEFVHRLLGFLADDGVAAFSFIDPAWTPSPGWAPGFEPISNLHERLLTRHAVNPDTDVPSLLAQAEKEELTWVSLVNDDELYFDPDEDGLSGDKPAYDYTTLCTAEYMSQLFPRARIIDPVSPMPMHCLLLDRASMD